jgi:hypothetical protein
MFKKVQLLNRVQLLNGDQLLNEDQHLKGAQLNFSYLYVRINYLFFTCMRFFFKFLTQFYLPMDYRKVDNFFFHILQ